MFDSILRTSRTRSLFVVGGFALLLAIVALRAPQRRISSALFVSDGFGYYIYLPSLVIDHDWDLSNQLRHQPDQPRQQWYTFVPQTGRVGNCFQIGCAVLWSPFFLLAHASALAIQAFGVDVRTDGFGWAYELPVYCGSFAYGLAGVWFMWRLLSDLWDEAIATCAVFYIVTTTALAAYLWFEPDMSHVVSAFLISALFYTLNRVYQRDRLAWLDWAPVGALLGLILSVRVPDGLVAVAALMTGLAIGARHGWPWAKMASCILACAIASAVCFVPQMLAWKALYGGYLARPPNVYQTINWTHPDLVSYLFSTRRGLFVWTPLALVATLGLVIGARRGPLVVRLALSVLALAVWFNAGLLPGGWVGCSFGERRIVDFSVLFALGLGAFLSLRPRIVTLWGTHAVGLALCAFNWVLMLRYFTHDLPEYGPVSGYNLFVATLLWPLEKIAHFWGG